jgi:hypothetical protein
MSAFNCRSTNYSGDCNFKIFLFSDSYSVRIVSSRTKIKMQRKRKIRSDG